MQKDSKGRKESRAVGGGAQGEEPGKELGEGGITKGRRGSSAQGWAAIPLQRWMPFIRWAPQQLADVTHQFLFLLKRTEKKNVYTVQKSWHPLWDQPADTSEPLRVMS